MVVRMWRPAAERFHSQLDWLDSWHSFSFAGHHDPAWMGFGPLRVINDDTVAAGRGFGMHPHRDMEIITVMVDGQLSHRDSMGHSAVLRAGEVQRMSAGTGIVHSEINDGDGPCRLLQIWIEPSRSGLAPTYGQRRFAVAEDWTPLIDPGGVGGALAIERPAQLWRARPRPGQTLALPASLVATPATWIWLQLIEGSAALALAGRAQPQALHRGDGLGLDSDGDHGEASGSITAGPEGADLLLFGLR